MTRSFASVTRIRTSSPARAAVAAVLATLGLLVCAASAAAESYLSVGQFGTNGAGVGQFNAPERVAVDAAGNLYVADTGNHRVQVLSNTGAFGTPWGSEGTGDGQFRSPSGIAVSPGGTVYVTERGFDPAAPTRIQAFTSAGVFTDKDGSNVELQMPAGISVDSVGNVVVANTNVHRLRAFDTNLDLAGQSAGGFGTGNGQFNDPSGLDFDGGKLYVADRTNNRIQEFSDGVANVWTRTFGEGLSYPTDVAVHPTKGDVYVADSFNNQIQQYSATGAFKGSFGRNPSTGGGSGTLPGQFNRPTGLAFDATGNLFVADTFNNRIQKFVMSPEIKVKLNISPDNYPARFHLLVNGNTIKTGAAHGGEASVAVPRNSAVTVSEAPAPRQGGDSPLTHPGDFDISIDCGAGPQPGISLSLTNVTGDTTCTISNRMRTPKVTMINRMVPASDPGRFKLSVGNNGTYTTLNESAGDGDSGSTTLPQPNLSVTVRTDDVPGTLREDYVQTMDCGGGPQPGSEMQLTAVRDDVTCTATNTRKIEPRVILKHRLIPADAAVGSICRSSTTERASWSCPRRATAPRDPSR